MTANSISTEFPIADDLSDRFFSSFAPIFANLLATVLVTVLVVPALSHEQSSGIVIACAIANGAVCLAQIWLWKAYWRRRREMTTPERWLRHSSWLAGATGCLWGVLGLTLVAASGMADAVLVRLLIAAISMNLVSAHMPHLPVVRAFIYPAYLLVAIGDAFRGDAQHHFLAIFDLGFLVNLDVIARRGHHVLVQILLRTERLARAQRVAATGSAELDLATGIEHWSDEMYRLMGADPKSFVPTDANILAIVHAEDRERVKAAFSVKRRGQAPRPGDFRTVRPDGEVRTVHCEAEAQRDHTGSPMRVTMVFKDVTELRIAEQEGRSRQRMLERAQRMTAIGTHEIVTDRQTWSDEMYRLMGTDPVSLPWEKIDLLAFIHEDDRERTRKTIARVAAGKPTRPGEVRIVRPDGETRVIYVEVSRDTDAAGNPMVLGFFKDVTELRAAEAREKEMERRLAQSQKLEALGTLAGGVAHEVNNALVPTIALTKMVAGKLPEGSRERRNLLTALSGAEKSRDLVKQILAFSRKDDQKTLEPFDLTAMVRETVTMMRGSLPTTIRIDESIAAVPPVLGNANQMTQVMVNLITNAAQAIGEAMGAITVALSIAAPDADGRAMARLSVADTGCGMDDATRARIFEPFFTTKPAGSGTGLGLSIVHGIVTGHGGRIEVTSHAGEGAQFVVYLPLATEVQETGPEAADVGVST